IDEVRLWSSVRSDLDISNSYRSSIGSIATGLVLNWHLNDGSGDLIADASGGAHQGLNVGAAWTPSDLRLRTSKKDVGAGIPDFAIATASGTFFRTENFTANLTGSTFTIELWFKPQGSGVLVNEV